MILDSSAVIAIIAREPEATAYRQLIVRTKEVLISSATVVESCIVAYGKLGKGGLPAVWHLLESGEIEVIPLDSIQARAAADGFSRFGKGIHPAKLNLGDCFVYGLAKQRNMPILCKGNDFAQTDALIA